MIYGLGIDATSIERCLRLDEHFVRKTFHFDEVKEYENLSKASADIKAEFLASRFAVKEAYAKARGLGFCDTVVPHEICTCKDEEGKPFIRLDGVTKQNHPVDVKIHVSITHQKPLAVCVVVLEKE